MDDQGHFRPASARNNMKLIQLIEKAFRSLIPSPFTIAVVLTLITFMLAWTLTGSEYSGLDRFSELLGYWEKGLWNEPLMVFAMQMMLMLVLGHTLALTKPVDLLISGATRYCTTTSRAAFVVTFLTVLVGLFNWGLGLIFGAILARKVGEFAAAKRLDLNYPLIGAAGYSGLMVWHGGISGSAPIKVAETGHVQKLMDGILSTEELSKIPESYSFGETIFSPMNLTAIVAVLLILPLGMSLLGRKLKGTILPSRNEVKTEIEQEVTGAERLDHSTYFGMAIGAGIVLYLVVNTISNFNNTGLGFITPNFLNLLLLGMSLFFHRSISAFLSAIGEAIGGASGILIQFPLYFGIMGLMNSSGLVQIFSDFFVRISTEVTFPIYTFFSAGLVNIFVPSGGGQWGVQGPIIMKAAMDLGVSPQKAIMALAYGDQLTNMLQPFWALPLLGITGLKAREILPYTVALMGMGVLIFLSVLFIF